MKTRLNLTIDDDILNKMKAYAESKRISISELVENYFKRVAKPATRKNIVSMVDKLERPEGIDINADLKELFYKDHSEKYGF